MELTGLTTKYNPFEKLRNRSTNTSEKAIPCLWVADPFDVILISKFRAPTLERS